MKGLRRFWRRVTGGFVAVRRRYGWFDHAVRAAVRYDSVRAGRLAAAVTYHGFLAVFPLLIVAYAVLGYLVGRHATVTAEVSLFLEAYLPTLDVTRIAEARYTAGIIGVIGVLVTGLSWVDTLRSTIRVVWGKEETPGHAIVARLVDIGVLLALGLIFAASIALSVVINSGTGWALEHLGVRSGGLRAALAVVAFGVGVLVDVGIFVALLSGLPRLRMPLGRVIVPALIAAVGFEVLKTFSQLFLGHTTRNPAYTVVASAAGLLVFLNLLNQLLLYCAALTATSERGEVTERRALSSRWTGLRDDAARRGMVDSPTQGSGVATGG